MPTSQSAASIINLLDDENDPVQAQRPVEADGVSGDASNNVVLRVIARVEKTLGAGHGSASEQHSRLTAERLQRAAQEDHRWCSMEQNMHVRAETARHAAQQDRWRATEREAWHAAEQERFHPRLPAIPPDMTLQRCPRHVSRPLSRQEWAAAVYAVLAPEPGRIVLAPDAGRAVRMGRAVRLVCGLLDANGLVGRLERLLGSSVQRGAVEENGRRILEMVSPTK